MGDIIKIGVEASALGYPKGGGIRTYLYYALRELHALDSQNSYAVYTTASATEQQLPFPERGNDRWQVKRASGITAIKPVVWLQTGFLRASAKDDLDVLWLTRPVSPLLQRNALFVSTVFDLFYHRVPQVFSPHVRLFNRFFTQFTARRSKKIIVSSEATAHDLIEILDVDPTNISVAYAGVDHDRFFPRDQEEAFNKVSGEYCVDRKYILALDVYNERKNFLTALRAYSLLDPKLRGDYHIVAAGDPRGQPGISGRTQAEIKRLGLEGNVHLIGFAEEDTLPWLYSAASVLVFPSLYEGFGLPIVEAMACGCPVITSNVSSMPEAAGNAGLMADPGSPSQFSELLASVLTDSNLEQELRQRGIEHSAGFTWRNVAEVVRETIQAAAAST